MLRTLYPVVSGIETVRSITQDTKVSRFLYYYHLFYVRLSKNSFSTRQQAVCLKADAKVQLISETTKLFKGKIQKIKKKVFGIDTNQSI